MKVLVRFVSFLLLVTSVRGAEDESQPPPNAAATPRARRPDPTGLQIGENKATPVERIKTMKDFNVELLYSVPGGDQGSWVNLCADDKGRIYASDQYGGLYRFTAPPIGKVLRPQDITKVPASVRAINGMVFAFGVLYVGVNDYERKFQSGLYRLTDSDRDDQLDKVELLRAIESSKVSLMPAMLLNLLTKEEILDLLAYVLSGGNKNNPVFKL